MFYKTNREDLAVNLLDHLEGTESRFIKSQKEVKLEACRWDARDNSGNGKMVSLNVGEVF